MRGPLPLSALGSEGGDTLGIHYSVQLKETVTGGKLAVNAKVDLLTSFTLSCGPCGVNCSLVIPIVKIPVNFSCLLG